MARSPLEQESMMRHLRRNLSIAAVIALFTGAMLGVTSLPVTAEGDPDCTGECGCVLDPTGEYELCVYWPNASTCQFDSDCTCGGGGGEDPPPPPGG